MTDPSGTDPELTIDQLARRVGMTVRNVRAYAGRGLIPPPRLVGRTGYYGATHVTRLAFIRDMLEQGFTLAAVEKLLARAPENADAASLELARVLYDPWLRDTPEEMDRAELAAQAGVDPRNDEMLNQLVELGIVELISPTRVRVLNPPLLAAGLRVAQLGVPVPDLLAAQAQAVDHVREMARVYVDLIRKSLWRRVVDSGMSPDELSQVIQSIELLQPLAGQAVLATFRAALAGAIDEVIGMQAERMPSE